MPRHTRSRRSHYNVHWNWAMMDELVDIRRDRNRAYHNINGRSRYDFWDSVANRTMSFIVMVTLGGGCGRVPAKDIIANLERDFGRGRNSSEVARAFRKVYGAQNNPLTWPKLLQCDGGREFMGETSRLLQEHNVTIRVVGPYSHRGLAFVERFNQTLSKILYKIQYAIESISSDPKLIRAWGLEPVKAIALERVKSRPSTKYKRPVGKDEITLKKGDTVCYLLANAEWEGVVVIKNESVLYYLGSDDDGFVPKRGFVKEELMLIADPERVGRPP
ncbi:hypothetical protein RCL_jg16607.t1 [Rhizophagus clarus]|uniref:Integrase catalytic domain-containing protein n=1 Tax=Rhizophagus clarus TaxID=94130 RepID=A0A8H3LP32_9GLOM|nr:hypothetical protein RCL_jg16607.t1 [Rhizophagus clarus]